MSGDDSYVEFVSFRWSRLYRLAYLLTASKPAAEDLLQASLLKTYVNWPRVEKMAAPEAYVRTLMVNTLISSRRRLWWNREVTRGVLPEDPVESTERAALDHAEIWPLICALPERQRAVVVLRYYEDLTEADIAGLLGCTRGTVKSQSSDALRALRRGLTAMRLREETVAEP